MSGRMLKIVRLTGPMALACLVVGLTAGSGCPNLNNPPADDGNGDTTTPGNSGVTGKYAGSYLIDVDGDGDLDPPYCGTCHQSIHDDWAQTLHADALATLEAIGQGSNASCLPCHTVGFGEEGGFVDRATTDALANVGCEACHGPAKAHMSDPLSQAKLPTVSISADVCGKCHQGAHHPNFEDWESSLHAHVNAHVADGIIVGQSGRLSGCGLCHSGDAVYAVRIMPGTIADDALAGVAAEDLNGITCAICHDPHAQTGNAANPEEGRDFQLRYPEVTNPDPDNTIAGVTNAERFNVCGQCHHSRGTVWTATSRGPHHSLQANVFLGEMPVPDGDPPLVPSEVSVHSFTTEQCASCHMYRQDFQSEESPTVSGHTFEPNTKSCTTACHTQIHPSEAQAIQAKNTLAANVDAKLAEIEDRLGDTSAWWYTSDGGPDADGQAALDDSIKKVRFIYYYVINDGSKGIHNPAYVKALLDKARSLLDSYETANPGVLPF